MKGARIDGSYMEVALQERLPPLIWTMLILTGVGEKTEEVT